MNQPFISLNYKNGTRIKTVPIETKYMDQRFQNIFRFYTIWWNFSSCV